MVPSRLIFIRKFFPLGSDPNTTTPPSCVIAVTNASAVPDKVPNVLLQRIVPELFVLRTQARWFTSRLPDIYIYPVKVSPVKKDTSELAVP